MIDATVVGSGPNGLAAAVVLAQAGLEVHLIEAAPDLGGGLRTRELTLPGFHHDVCSTVHPMALASPFFQSFGLSDRIPFVVPEVSYGHAIAPGESGFAYRDLMRTGSELGVDGPAWKRTFGPLTEHIDGVSRLTTAHLLRPPAEIRAGAILARRVLRFAAQSTDRIFAGSAASALFAGVAAHSGSALPSLTGAGVGLTLGAHAHAAGWGLPVGGSTRIAEALAAAFTASGGKIFVDRAVAGVGDLERSRIVLLDTSPEFLRSFAGNRLPWAYAKQLRSYRHGVAVAKVDFALDGPVPWKDSGLTQTPTVHIGGSASETAHSEHEVSRGRVSDRPYVLAVQPTVVDSSRAPAGKHVLWTYIHVPNGSQLDATEIVATRIEHFAPGFRDLILASNSSSARDLAAANPNDVGGDIFGGALTPWQLIKRPTLSLNPWKTPVKGLYLCSAATPPGPAVHGMGGWHAARLALKHHFGIETTLGN